MLEPTLPYDAANSAGAPSVRGSLVGRRTTTRRSPGRRPRRATESGLNGADRSRLLGPFRAAGSYSEHVVLREPRAAYVPLVRRTLSARTDIFLDSPLR